MGTFMVFHGVNKPKNDEFSAKFSAKSEGLMEFLELIIRCAFKGLDLALRAGTGEKSYANWSICTSNLQYGSEIDRSAGTTYDEFKRFSEPRTTTPHLVISEPRTQMTPFRRRRKIRIKA